MTNDDLQFIARLRARDHDAFIELFNRFFKQLTSVAANYICNEDDARDIVQELFLDLYEKGEALDIHSDIKAYLFRATRNRSLNFLRSLNIKDSRNENMIEAHLRTNTLQEFESYGNATAEEVMKVAEGMPAGQREVFRLRIDEYKYKEIADRLGISENNAKVQMNKAVKSLLKELSFSDI